MTALPLPLPALEPDELRRYGRHLLLPEVGVDGQRKLKRSRVLIIGAGGLGSPLALYLAAAGVGTLGLVDFDTVELSNLQRQVLHGTRDVGRRKLDSARDRIADVNPLVKIESHDTRLSAENALAIVGAYDLVVDGTDNFATRYLVNDACVLSGRPNVYGSIFRFDGQVSVFATADGPCYRCVYPEPPPPGLVPSCADGGVLGVLPGLVGTLQATEVLKLLLGIGTPLAGRLLLVDALHGGVRTVRIRRDPACPACGTRQLTALVDYEAFCGVSAAREPDADVPRITPHALAARLSAGDDVQVLDVREPHEWELAHLHGARLVPLMALGDALPTLDRERDLVVHCKVGGRSAKAVRLLRDAGFTRVWNLSGGIDRWRTDVDPSLPAA
ncbi:MAG TPA: molybdopterin-synthase adenylyltransferase MoeB [Gemmatimonadaceae bacterium]|nr:molybdopterin-synthase adenylyltransferase MoeB [Gemmatimonadaceae bacterium]